MKQEIRLIQPLGLFIRIRHGSRLRELLSLLDTGSSYVVIPREDALALGYDLQQARMIRLTTAGGPVDAPVVVLDEVSIGAASVRNVEAVCCNLPSANVTALLGMSFLEHFVVTPDARRGVLELDWTDE